jgi:hypothetical protein
MKNSYVRKIQIKEGKKRGKVWKKKMFMVFLGFLFFFFQLDLT